MFQHFLVTAWRMYARHKLYSFINIAGLTFSLASAALIVLFLRYELSFDKWIPQSENLYRIELTYHMPGRDPTPLAQSPFPLLRAMREEIPEVKSTMHVVPSEKTATVGDRQFLETVTVVDVDFFQLIKIPLARGEAGSVFAQPESIVLSESIAKKYFGDSDPLGKTITLTGVYDTDPHLVTVTGILKDLPSNTHLVADLVLPNTSQADEMTPERKETAWTSTDGTYSYVELLPGTDPQTVLDKVPALLDRHFDPSRPNIKLRASELETFNLTHFWDAHLSSDKYGGMRPPGSWSTVYGFAVTALLIILVACANFTNLATARATLRQREISLRKVVGATRGQLIAQFLGEALLTAVVSLVIALALVEILLPIYGNFLNAHLEFHYLADWALLLAFLGGALVAGLLGGIYPAFVLSSFQPAAGLRSNGGMKGGSGIVRSALVVSQFAISIGLGIVTIVVFSQISYARKIDLGFNQDGVVVVRDVTKLAPSARESLVRAVKANPQVVEAALSNSVPFDLRNASNVPISAEGSPQSFTAHIINVSPEFPTLYDLKLLAGRLLSSSYGEDVYSEESGGNVMVNAEAVRRFGFTNQQALGKTVTFGKGRRVRIVGVLADSLFDGMRDAVTPTLYWDEPEEDTMMSVRVRPQGIPEALAHIDKTWRSFAPGAAIQRYFLSDVFDEIFESDEKQGVMLGVFVGIAILIACLGLFGLAIFTAARRTKEIGIRKVFGARTTDIVRMLLWKISSPVLVANLIAWPAAYFYLNHWLKNYAYQVSLRPAYFLIASAVAMAIACFTVFAHVVRLGKASPIQALRYE